LIGKENMSQERQIGERSQKCKDAGAELDMNEVYRVASIIRNAGRLNEANAPGPSFEGIDPGILKAAQQIVIDEWKNRPSPLNY